MVLSLSRALVQAQARRAYTHHTWVSGPPRTRISFAEKCVHGALIAAGVVAGQDTAYLRGSATSMILHRTRVGPHKHRELQEEGLKTLLLLPP
jgi:hypothetical protein